MNIHQLSVTYLPEQDRILARINTTQAEEMRLWLTRRLMVGLWPLLSKAMTEQLLRLEAAGSSLESASDELRTMLADFRKQEFLRSADFDTPYQDMHPKLPLGEEPLLRLEAAGSSLESASDELRTMLADFRKQEFLRNADFDTPYQDKQPKLPLGEEPLLVTDVDAAPMPNGRLRLSFNETLPHPAEGAEPRRFQMEMEPRLMQGLLHLLEQALVQSAWRDAFMPAQSDDPTLPDGATRSSRPRYLN